MRRIHLAITGALLAAAGLIATPASANHACTHPSDLVADVLGAGHAPAGGESQWWRLRSSGPVRVQIWNTSSQTAMQIFTSDCNTLICNTAQFGGTCLTNGGEWRIRVWSSGGSDYAVTVTPVV